MSRVKDLLAGTGYWLGWKAICHLPQSWVRWAFSTVTEIAWRRQGRGVQVLEGNLLRVLGPGTSGKELRAASRAGMRSYGRYWMEVFRLPVISRERILADTVSNCGEQAAFAQQVGVHANSVARWEREEMAVRESAVRLIRLLGRGVTVAKTAGSRGK